MAVEAKTYYLMDDISPTTKKFDSLEGWRLAIAKVLVRKRIDDAQALSEISSLIKKEKSHDQKKEDGRALLEGFIEILPKNVRTKAKILAHHLIHHITVDESGRVVYPDGRKGGSIIDHLRYFCSPGQFKPPAPDDVDKMTRLLLSTSAPRSSFTLPAARKRVLVSSRGDGGGANNTSKKKKKRTEKSWITTY